jgi:hypothetical protein
MCILKLVHEYIPMDRSNQVNQEKDGDSNIHKGERSMKWSRTLVLPSAVFNKQIQTLGPDWSVPHLLISKKVKYGWWKIRLYIMDVVKVELKKIAF